MRFIADAHAPWRLVRCGAPRLGMKTVLRYKWPHLYETWETVL